jgi:carbonic anhydrase
VMYHRGWREAMVSKDPDHFSKLAETQSPEYLWIGCADSRVPVRSLRTLAHQHLLEVYSRACAVSMTQCKSALSIEC